MPEFWCHFVTLLVDKSRDKEKSNTTYGGNVQVFTSYISILI